MITVRKLFSLKDGTRDRKLIKILGEWERNLPEIGLPDKAYLNDLYKGLDGSDLLSSYRMKYGKFTGFSSDTSEFKREVNRLRHELLLSQGVSSADWDILHKPDRESSGRTVFPGRIFLDEIRSPYNVGSIFRTAECLGVQEILISPGTADPGHPRASRTSMGCTETVPWKRFSYDDLESLKLPVFAMELGGTEIEGFSFPEEGILILGSEELGVSPECMKLAMSSGGVISIPLYGNKASLNVSVAFGIIMNAWAGFQSSRQR